MVPVYTPIDTSEHIWKSVPQDRGYIGPANGLSSSFRKSHSIRYMACNMAYFPEDSRKKLPKLTKFRPNYASYKIAKLTHITYLRNL
jgi:hypothetical protein